MPAKAFNPSSSGAPPSFRADKDDVMPMTGKQEELADLLVRARRNVSQLPTLPDDLVPDTALDAYAVNQTVAERLGWEPLGWKIAGKTGAGGGKIRLGGPSVAMDFLCLARRP